MQLDILGRKLGISSEIGRHALGKDKIQVRSWLGVSDQTALRNLTVPEAYDLMVQLWGRAEVRDTKEYAHCSEPFYRNPLE